MADQLVDQGFAEAGYTLVGIDDCWLAKTRDSDGRLQADRKRFPSGIKALAQYIHKQGLQLGIYGDIGSKTCGGYPGMAGSLQKDAETYADWGIDYLKVDGCYADPKQYSEDYPLLGHYLNDTGRPITYSCSWPAYLPDPVKTGFQVPYKALREHCNLWRNWVDIQDSWESLTLIIVFWAKESLHNKQFQQAAGPGAWNDPDMLIIGNQGLRTREENEVQMGMWAIFAAPLLMSNDLRSISGLAKDVLLNDLLIKINQDPLGNQGKVIACLDQSCHGQIWYRILQENARAFVFLNLSDQDVDERQCVTWQDVGWQKDMKAQVTGVLQTNQGTEIVEGGEYCVGGIKSRSLVLVLAKIGSDLQQRDLPAKK